MPNNQGPLGAPTTQPLPTGANLTPPPLPNITQVGSKPPVPSEWNDPLRIMAQVIDVLQREGQPAATSLLAWVKNH